MTKVHQPKPLVSEPVSALVFHQAQKLSGASWAGLGETCFCRNVLPGVQVVTSANTGA